jgi:hypothetical protein
MNRRNFIKSVGILTTGIPAIVSAIEPDAVPLEGIKYDGADYITIFTVEELKQFNIRSATFSASCVDKNGKFAHDKGYDMDHSEPFVRKTFVLKSLPKIFSNKRKDVYPVLGKMRSGVDLGGKEYSSEKVIAEIKEHMEYVCMVSYFQCPCLCGKETCPKTWVPIVGGLTKSRYKQFLKELNEPKIIS